MKKIYKIDVKKPSVTISGIPEQCAVGDEIDISAELTGDFPAFESGGYFTYEFSSTDDEVLRLSNTSKRVSNNNSFEVLNPGHEYITVKVYAENRNYNITPVLVAEKTVRVYIKSPEPESITISPEELTLGVNESQYLDCTILPSEASQEVTWKSEDPTVATVSSSGKVTGKKAGTTTITAKTSNGLTSKCKVTVAQLYLIDGIRYEMPQFGILSVCPLSSGKYKGDIVIPETVSIGGGKTYKVCYISNNAFKGCTELTSIQLNLISHIGKSAFEGCTGLNVIQILFESECGRLNSCAFCENAFKGCYNLKKVYIDKLNSWANANIDGNALGNPLWPGSAELYLNGEKVVNLTVPVPYSKKLRFALFGHCSSIESVSLAEGIESIEGRVFQGCENLRNITLPSSLREIEGYAFAWCDNIETVNCYATTPPDMETEWLYDGVFLDFNEYFAFYESSPQKITLHVPKGCMQAYANAPGWNLFSVIIDDLEPKAGVNEIVADNPDNSTKDVYNLQGVLIKNNATQEEIESLPAGMYIIGGKKVLVR